MKRREILSEPITPAVGGTPPAFVVACLKCEFSVDAHALSAEDAVKAVAPTHEPTHLLIARPVDYTTGYGTDKTAPHPLYGR